MSEQLFKIGRVSELTGLSVERLRMWEHRHEIVPAKRVNRIRYYDRPQLDQLIMMKELIDQGFSIRELRELTPAELKRLMGHATDASVQSSLSILLVGDVWEFEDPSVDMEYEVVCRALTLDAFQRQLSTEAIDANAAVVLISSLDVTKLVEVIPELDLPCVVVYKFASAQDLEDAKEASLTVSKFRDTDWFSTLETLMVLVNSKHFEEGVQLSDEELEHLRRCQARDGFEPVSLVEVIYQQRALIEHLRRHTDDATDLTILETIKSSEVAMQQALKTLADKHELLT